MTLPTARSPVLLATLVLAVVLGACASADADPDPVTAEPKVPGLALVPRGGADVYETRGGAIQVRAAGGLVFPVMEVSDDWFQVMVTCGRDAWVEASSVQVVAQEAPGTPGPGFDLSQAVIVIDPGHGGRDLGAVGPGGTTEAEVNVEIAALLRRRLESSSLIEWDTGRIRPGDVYSPVSAVWLTRAPEGPLDGDVELGLGYRAQVANRVGADALVSIHNNSAPTATSPTPGTDVFYSVSSPGSDRLASLIHQEMVKELGPLSTEWGSAEISGPKTRVFPDNGEDFYGLLRNADPPSVIVEGMYISQSREEAILNTSVGRQAYADAVYRGLIRFLTTDQWGSEVLDPEPFDADVGRVTNEACVVPEQ